MFSCVKKEKGALSNRDERLALGLSGSVWGVDGHGGRTGATNLVHFVDMGKK
jgi:hypothetical protein